MSKRNFSEVSGDMDANDAISAIIKHAEDLLKAACTFKKDLESGKQPENKTSGSISEISRNLLPALTYFAGSSPTQQPTSSNKAPKLDESQRSKECLKLPTFVGLTPWTPGDICSSMPPLPTVDDPVLEKAACTHQGMVSRPGEMSYERLEWVGDAYLEIMSTIFIYQTFPNLPVGRCSSPYRESLIKNETLAKYTLAYELDKRIIFPKEFDMGSKTNGQGAKATTYKKVLADIFEAYVAAVILGDPEFGLVRVSSWMKALWSKELVKEIKDEYRSRQRIQQEATQADGDTAASCNTDAKNRLVQKIGMKGVKIYYQDERVSKDKKTGHDRFTVGVFVDAWGEIGVKLGSGTALSKTEARTKAAQNALDNKKVIQPFEKKKKDFTDAMNAPLQY